MNQITLAFSFANKYVVRDAYDVNITQVLRRLSTKSSGITQMKEGVVQGCKILL